MPVVVQTRAYDAKFYQEVGDMDWEGMETDLLLTAAESAKLDLGF
jgi:hypothetical protein